MPIVALAILAFVSSVRAEGRFTVNPKAEILLKPGLNDLDLAFNGDTYHALVLINDVASAHNNETFEFLTPDNRRVTFEGGEGKAPLDFPGIHSPSVSTSQGADDRVQSVRLLMDFKARKAFVVVARRDFGQTWIDARPVTFELFQFSRNADQNPGEPPAQFGLVSWFKTAKCYADSDVALARELGFALPEDHLGEGDQACSK